MPGDKIIAIDGEDAYKITKTEVFEKLRGRKGSLVTVTISRMGMMKPFDVDIIRDDIPIKMKTATSTRNIAANMPENL